MTEADNLMIYAQFGDLHLTIEHEGSYHDLRAIVGNIVTGGHGNRDMEPGGLDNLYASLNVLRLPKAVDAGGDGEPAPMHPHITLRERSGAPTRYALGIDLPDGAATIRVEAEDDGGQIGFEAIEIATRAHLGVERHADGSDADALGAWPERGLLGTQLGSIRNGRMW